MWLSSYALARWIEESLHDLTLREFIGVFSRSELVFDCRSARFWDVFVLNHSC